MKYSIIKHLPMALVVVGVLFFSCTEQPSIRNTLIENAVANGVPFSGIAPKAIAEDYKGISCVYQDRKGRYWLGTQGAGVYGYDNVVRIRLTQENGLCGNFVSSIQEDAHGYLWFTTSQGLCRFDGEHISNFTDTLKHTTKPSNPAKFKPEDLFFFQEGNVYHFDGQQFTKFDIHPPSYQASEINLDRPYGAYCMLRDRKGNLWFGTDQKGVVRFDGKMFTYYTEKGLAGGAVRSIFQDSKGKLWFGNNGYGLFSFDGTTLENFTEQRGLANPDFLNKKNNKAAQSNTLARVWAINEDYNGNLWFGTIDAGAWRYNGKDLQQYTVRDGLPSNSILSIYRDRKETLWFVVEHAGVYQFDGTQFATPAITKP